MFFRCIPCLLLALAFVGCSSRGYQREGGRWAWVWYDGEGRQVQHLDSARGELTVLSNPNYAATADRVYLWGVWLPEADPASFELLTYPYSRDTRQVYCGSIPIAGADPNTFQVLGGLLDPARVSPAAAFENVVGPLTSVPADTAIVAAQAWSKDGRRCFFGPTPLSAADPGSFVVLNDWFAHDDQQVYCGHQTIPQADAATFRITGPFTAQDKHRAYSKWQLEKK